MGGYVQRGGRLPAVREARGLRACVRQSLFVVLKTDHGRDDGRGISRVRPRFRNEWRYQAGSGSASCKLRGHTHQRVFRLLAVALFNVTKDQV